MSSWHGTFSNFYCREVYAVSIVGPFPLAVTNLVDLTRLYDPLFFCSGLIVLNFGIVWNWDVAKLLFYFDFVFSFLYMIEFLKTCVNGGWIKMVLAVEVYFVSTDSELFLGSFLVLKFAKFFIVAGIYIITSLLGRFHHRLGGWSISRYCIVLYFRMHEQ